MQISDAESQYVRRSDCDTLFIVANYQPDKKDPSVAVNDEHALLRFEFLEAVVRLAVAKYGKVCLHPISLNRFCFYLQCLSVNKHRKVSGKRPLYARSKHLNI